MTRILFCTFLIGIVSSAAMAAPPMDCSKGPVPSGPVVGKIANATFHPKEIALVVSGSMDENDQKFDTYTLTFREPTGEAESRSFDMQFLVRKGTKPDGHSWHQVPGSVGVQPKAGQSDFAEVQAWSISDDHADVDIHSVSTDDGSLQVSFGKRAGTHIPGTIHICSPDQPSASIGGSFSADLNPQ